jgi:hypothetical protein
VVQEMLAGRISACFCSYVSIQQHIRSGALRMIAVTGVARSPLAPQVPTLQESGIEGYGAAAWYGVMAPAKTPRAIVAKLANELDNVTEEREVRARMLAAGLTPMRTRLRHSPRPSARNRPSGRSSCVRQGNTAILKCFCQAKILLLTIVIVSEQCGHHLEPALGRY